MFGDEVVRGCIQWVGAVWNEMRVWNGADTCCLVDGNIWRCIKGETREVLGDGDTGATRQVASHASAGSASSVFSMDWGRLVALEIAAIGACIVKSSCLMEMCI